MKTKQTHTNWTRWARIATVAVLIAGAVGAANASPRRWFGQPQRHRRPVREARTIVPTTVPVEWAESSWSDINRVIVERAEVDPDLAEGGDTVVWRGRAYVVVAGVWHTSIGGIWRMVPPPAIP